MSKSDEHFEKEITTDLEVGNDVYDVTFTRKATIVNDPDYGADADGRRGMSMDFVEDDRYEDVTVSKYVEATDSMTEPVALETLPQAEREALEAALDAYLDKHDI